MPLIADLESMYLDLLCLFLNNTNTMDIYNLTIKNQQQRNLFSYAFIF